MKNFTIIFIFLLTINIFGQDTESSDNPEMKITDKNVSCPKIEVTTPPIDLKAGDLAVYSVNLNGEFDRGKVSYKWEVQRASLLNGQGTPAITIDTIKGKSLDGIKVKLKIRGLPKVCQSTYVSDLGKLSESLKPPESTLIDEFGRLTECDVTARMDALFIEIQNSYPISRGYIINYGTARQIAARERMLKNFIKLRRFDVSNFVFVNGGVEKSIRTRLWIVPEGADLSLID